MIFSERHEISKKVDDWLERHRAPHTSLNVLGALDALGYLEPKPAPAPVVGDENDPVEAWQYLTRLLQTAHPGTEPLDSLMGVCSQLDNALTVPLEFKANAEALAALVLEFFDGKLSRPLNDQQNEMRRLAALIVAPDGGG